MTTICMCATYGISDTITSRRDRVITRAALPKAKVTTISLADRVIAAMPRAKATTAFAEAVVTLKDLAKVLNVGVGENALLLFCVVRSHVICFSEGDHRKKQ